MKEEELRRAVQSLLSESIEQEIGFQVLYTLKDLRMFLVGSEEEFDFESEDEKEKEKSNFGFMRHGKFSIVDINRDPTTWGLNIQIYRKRSKWNLYYFIVGCAVWSIYICIFLLKKISLYQNHIYLTRENDITNLTPVSKARTSIMSAVSNSSKAKQSSSKKCFEAFEECNNASIFSNINQNKNLLTHFLVENLITPFDYFKSDLSRNFMTDSQNKKMLHKAVRALLTAARNLYGGPGVSVDYLKFQKVDLEETGLVTPFVDAQTENNASHFKGEEGKDPSRLKVEPAIPEDPKSNLSRKKSSLSSSKKGSKSKSRKKTREKEKERKTVMIDVEISDTVGGGEFVKFPLENLILIVPEFEKSNEKLCFAKKKELKRNPRTEMEWHDFETDFKCDSHAGDYSYTNFDTLIHEFGPQSFLIRSLFSFLDKNTDALKVKTENTQRTEVVQEMLISEEAEDAYEEDMEENSEVLAIDAKSGKFLVYKIQQYLLSYFLI